MTLQERRNENRNKMFNGIIAKNIETSGISKSQLAVRMNMSRSSLYLKLKDPNKFTLGELRSICDILKIAQNDKAELASII